MITHKELRDKYITFFQKKAHTSIEPAPLVLQGDATTLFTSAGMQPLVPYLSGKEHHKDGKRLVDVQPCIRTGDIEEVGDNRHTTFFEMMGNWSIGDYFKQEQLEWVWAFFTSELRLDKNKLYVTLFEGNDVVPRDEVAFKTFKQLGISEDHIYEYGTEHNWWSRSGTPENMPAGEIGGPSCEIFYDFGDGPHSGPQVDEDRFLEIGNSVFIQYEKEKSGNLKQLPLKNVDFGGGLERILAAVEKQPDIFKTSLFAPLMSEIEKISLKSYAEYPQEMQVIADHMRASVFLLKDGVLPANKEHGYILRRLMRRAAVKMYQIFDDVDAVGKLSLLVNSVVSTYGDLYFKDVDPNGLIQSVDQEMIRFSKTLAKGMKIFNDYSKDELNALNAFNLFQSYGFPFELTQELSQQKGVTIDEEEFLAIKKKHQELSRTASAGKFKGGLADTSDQVIKYHTATHLLHQALKDVLGETVRQEGSNITQKRLRFDFKLDRKPTPEEVRKVEYIINTKIKEELPVTKKVMPKLDAEKIGAASFFKEKYGDEVSVYIIGDAENPKDAYSKEFCGGPHVKNTSEIESIELFKVKKIGSQLIRIYGR